jgi:hypothetical protein
MESGVDHRSVAEKPCNPGPSSRSLFWLSASRSPNPQERLRSIALDVAIINAQAHEKECQRSTGDTVCLSILWCAWYPDFLHLSLTRVRHRVRLTLIQNERCSY